MDTCGYIFTNQFILIAADTNIFISAGGTSNDDAIRMRLPNVQKVRVLTPTTAVVVIGIPHKSGDIHNYLNAMQQPQQSFDEVVDDIESLFETSPAEAERRVRQIMELIPASNDEHGAFQLENLLAHLEGDESLQMMAKETMQLSASGGSPATHVFILGRQDAKNVYASYVLLGLNLIGRREYNMPVDAFDFILCSSVASPAQVEQMQASYIQRLVSDLPSGWEEDPAQIEAFKQQARGFLHEALTLLNPYEEMSPNIVFYELSQETDNVFRSPDQHLINLNIHRPSE